MHLIFKDLPLDSSTECLPETLTSDCSLIDFYLKLHGKNPEQLEVSLKNTGSIYPSTYSSLYP